MKLCVISLLLIPTMVVYRQEKRPKTKSDQQGFEQIQPTSTPPVTISVHEATPPKQEHTAKEDAEEYLRSLFSPANLPNIGLLIAGIIGIRVAIRTLVAIRRQGIEMKAQRIEMKRQRDVMQGQFETMKGQLGEMASQTSALKESVGVAKQSAKAALDNLRLMKSKERAILSFKVTNISVTPYTPKGLPDGIKLKIQGKLSNRGATRADVSGAWFFLAYVDDVDEAPNTTQQIQLNIPPVIYPADRGATEEFSQERILKEGMKMLLREGKFVGFYPSITYKDVFGDEHTLHVREIWGLIEPSGPANGAVIEGVELGASSHQEDASSNTDT